MYAKSENQPEKSSSSQKASYKTEVKTSEYENSPYPPQVVMIKQKTRELQYIFEIEFFLTKTRQMEKKELDK